MATMNVSISNELLDELIEKFKDARPNEMPNAFGILLALSELKRVRATGLTPEEISTLKAERDAAIEEIKRLLLHLKPFQCSLCKHHKNGDCCESEYICISPKSGGVPSGWEWRGLEANHEQN